MKKISTLIIATALAACGGGHGGGAPYTPSPEPLPEPYVPSMELEPLREEPDNAISRVMARLEDGEGVIAPTIYSSFGQGLRLAKIDNGINATGIFFNDSSVFIPANDYTNIAIRPDDYVLLAAEDISPQYKNMTITLGGNAPITTYIDGRPLETKLSYMDWGIWQHDNIVSASIQQHFSRGFVVEDTALSCGGASCKITPEALPAENYKFYGNTLAVVSERYTDDHYVHTDRTGKVVLDFNPAAAANITLDFDNWHTIQLNGIALNGQSGYSDPNFTASIADGGKVWGGAHYRIEDFSSVNYIQNTAMYGKDGNPREAAGSYLLSLGANESYPNNISSVDIQGAFGAVRGN